MDPAYVEPEVIVCHGKIPFSNPPLATMFVPEGAEVGAGLVDGEGVIVGVVDGVGFGVVVGAV
jgi:hypothetical protein